MLGLSLTEHISLLVQTNGHFTAQSRQSDLLSGLSKWANQSADWAWYRGTINRGRGQAARTTIRGVDKHGMSVTHCCVVRGATSVSFARELRSDMICHQSLFKLEANMAFTRYPNLTSSLHVSRCHELRGKTAATG